jgi:hypothetical protein
MIIHENSRPIRQIAIYSRQHQRSSTPDALFVDGCIVSRY